MRQGCRLGLTLAAENEQLTETVRNSTRADAPAILDADHQRSPAIVNGEPELAV